MFGPDSDDAPHCRARCRLLEDERHREQRAEDARRWEAGRAARVAEAAARSAAIEAQRLADEQAKRERRAQCGPKKRSLERQQKAGGFRSSRWTLPPK